MLQKALTSTSLLIPKHVTVKTGLGNKRIVNGDKLPDQLPPPQKDKVNEKEHRQKSTRKGGH